MAAVNPNLFELNIYCRQCNQDRKVIFRIGNTELLCDVCGSTLTKIEPIEGYVYILTNPRLGNLLKIGCTKRSVEERRVELSNSTSTPEPFVVHAAFRSSAPDKDEREIHRQLEKVRLKGREFFELAPSEAIKICQSVCGSLPELGVVTENKCPKCGVELQEYSSMSGHKSIRCQACSFSR